jgi:predicted HAD superfamily Cof-like phosphohydrolase
MERIFMMKDSVYKVLQFHETFRCFTRHTPTGRIPESEAAIRATLLQEELEEYRAAAGAGDLAGIADALTDLLYVLFGTFVAHGLQDLVDELFEEVHRSNMSKLDERGEPIFREDGKVLKSKLFTQPDILSILEKHFTEE